LTVIGIPACTAEKSYNDFRSIQMHFTDYFIFYISNCHIAVETKSALVQD